MGYWRYIVNVEMAAVQCMVLGVFCNMIQARNEANRDKNPVAEPVLKSMKRMRPKRVVDE